MDTPTAQIVPLSAKNAIQVIDGKPVTTSVAIADRFEKRHDNVIKAIRQLDCSPEFNALNFEAVEYLDSKGERRPMYHITRDGFVFLCMGFTGKEAARWKEAYINAFNEMEKALLTHPDYRPEITREVHTGGLTLEQQDAIKALHKTLVEDVPHEQKARMSIKLWSSVKAKFGVGYKDVPPTDFANVISLMSRVAAETKHLPHPGENTTAPEDALTAFQNALGDTAMVVSLSKDGQRSVKMLAPGTVMVDPARWAECVADFAPQEQLLKIIDGACKKLIAVSGDTQEKTPVSRRGFLPHLLISSLP